jgi:hypothetical protein
VATGIEQGVKATQAAYVEQLQALQRELQKVSEYGPRIEMSRTFPSRLDELLDLGIKHQAETDLQRFCEYDLPVTTFLQEKFLEKKITRISTCFSKTFKQRRLELYREDPEEHRIFLLYHQGEWRIAYFEDDRPACHAGDHSAPPRCGGDRRGKQQAAPNPPDRVCSSISG